MTSKELHSELKRRRNTLEREAIEDKNESRKRYKMQTAKAFNQAAKYIAYELLLAENQDI